MMVFDDGKYQHIKCDCCDRISPPAKELIENHGLIGLGWYASGGKHRCPEHYNASVS